MIGRKFNIGHGAYSGANRYACHATYSSALRDLLSRRVPMPHAHRALKSALSGSHATCSVYSTAPSGRKVAIDTVEVTAQAS